MKRLLPLLLLPALLCASLSTVAAGVLRPAPPMVDLQVADREDGRVLPQYPHRGQAWLPGEPGHRYAVRLRNSSAQRVLVVLSVDGINAISGQTADPRQAGYVLGPWQALEVAGWRKSLDAVAQFVFVDPGDSYAARTGRPDNLGVIGIAVYRERSAPEPQVGIAAAGPGAEMETQQRTVAPAMPRASAKPATDAASRYESAPTLGTGHGQVEGAPAYATTFDRQSRPAQVTQLRYDTRQALLARGIAVPYPVVTHGWRDAPQAFPSGFVPDPPCCADR